MLVVSFQMMGQEGWELEKNKEGIQVYTRSNTVSNFKEFKAVSVMEGTVSSFLSVMYDVSGLTEWGHNMAEARLLDRPNDQNQRYYAVAKAPWPTKNRAGVYINVFSWDKVRKELRVDISTSDEEIEGDSDYIRIEGYGHWLVTQLPDEKLAIVFQMQVDPGGSIKSWIANMFVTDSPYYTMLGMRKALQDEKYQGKTYEFIVD